MDRADTLVDGSVENAEAPAPEGAGNIPADGRLAVEKLDDLGGTELARFGEGDDPAALLEGFADRWRGNPRVFDRTDGPVEGQVGPLPGEDVDARLAAFDAGETTTNWADARAIAATGRTGFVDHVVLRDSAIGVERVSGELEAYQELPPPADEFSEPYVRVATGEQAVQIPWSSVTRLGPASAEAATPASHRKYDEPGRPVEAFGGHSPVNDLVTDAVTAARHQADVQSKLEGRHTGDGSGPDPTPDEWRATFDAGEATITGHTWRASDGVDAIAGTGRRVIVDHVVSDGTSIGVERTHGLLMGIEKPGPEEWTRDYLVVGDENGDGDAAGDVTRIPFTNFVRMGPALETPALDTPADDADAEG